MPDFTTVEDTLFVPMLGRIYASEHFPHILYDEKALELKAKLPKNIKGADTQTQYTFLASAVRSTNMDRYIKKFMKEHENGVVAQLGCGLETTFYRDTNKKTVFFELDLPEVIGYRKEILGSTDLDRAVEADAFSEEWIQNIRKEFPTEPILVTASGLFYYFEEKTVLNLFKNLKKYGNIEILFDTVNKSGMKRMSKYMKQVGHEEASMYFYVDKASELASEIGATVLNEEPYYAHTEKKGLKLMTSLSMRISDRCMMVKMVHLKLN